MKRFIVAVCAVAFYSGTYGQVDTSKSRFWMMTYFINGQDYTGTRLAFSSDTTGVRWQKYNNEAAVIVPSGTLPGADGYRMRDPMIAYDSVNRMFNIVWTTEWTGKVIGWDTSSLLKNNTWGPQVGLRVSNSITNSSFSWAPEIFWDDIQSRYEIIWSVAISGTNTRMYYTRIPNARTRGWDFTSFTTPQVLINTGYDLIDGSIIKVATNKYQMFFKDERSGYKYIRRAYNSSSNTPSGTFPTVTGIVANAPTEGPTIYRAGGEYRLIVDHYSNVGFGVCHSRNIDSALSPWPETWCTYGAGTSRFVGSHGNVIEVPKMLVKWMLYNDSAWVYYVRASSLRDVNWTPLKPAAPAETRVFNLAGRMVDMKVNLDGHAGPARSFVGRMPPGFYIKIAGDQKESAVKVESRK
ncbi:MAG: hypothetical protein JW699_03705 [Chitinispirillaceae bacterium]|nr:hypothetical protein [Chitinispirillaceae bacterium]